MLKSANQCDETRPLIYSRSLRQQQATARGFANNDDQGRVLIVNVGALSPFVKTGPADDQLRLQNGTWIRWNIAPEDQ